MSLPVELCIACPFSTLLAMLTSCLIRAVKAAQLATFVTPFAVVGRSRWWSRGIRPGLSKSRRVEGERDHQDEQTHHHFASHHCVPPVADPAGIMCARTA
jgi:hypothetical protein